MLLWLLWTFYNSPEPNLQTSSTLLELLSMNSWSESETLIFLYTCSSSVHFLFIYFRAFSTCFCTIAFTSCLVNLSFCQIDCSFSVLLAWPVLWAWYLHPWYVRTCCGSEKRLSCVSLIWVLVLRISESYCFPSLGPFLAFLIISSFLRENLMWLIFLDFQWGILP